MSPPSSPQTEAIAKAFSLTAEKYDRLAHDHPNLRRIRHKVYAHLVAYLSSGARILELNAGTGTDAVHLAQIGYSVHATDLAPGMLARLGAKVERLGLGEAISFQRCSFTALEQVRSGPFDAVFSNLGGLNCLADLRVVSSQLPEVLLPGGIVTWVLMPPVCPWELARAIAGDFKYAFRRFSHEGTLAHLEGQFFPVYYFTPRQVLDALGSHFKLLAVEGLSVFAPPAESKNLAKRHPRLYKFLCWLDDRLAHLPPFHGWGDFFLISLQYDPISVE
jgi:ubiquinone/menaquinone biosynthesis C-methylase UbiE